jgi:ATP-binding cassette, subfamily F, member 3
MSDVAFEIRDALPPGTIDEVVVQYLSGLYEDPDEEPDDVLKLTKEMLQSAVRGHAQELQGLIQRLTERMQAKALTRSAQQRPTLTRLDNVIDMSKAGALSSTIGFNESVDLSSTNKGK